MRRVIAIGFIVLALSSRAFAARHALPESYDRYAAFLAREGISFSSAQSEAQRDVTVTCDFVSLKKHLQSLSEYGLPSLRSDLIERLPDAAALFYTLVLTKGYLRRVYNQTDTDEVNLRIRFGPAPGVPAGELIGSITMNRDKAAEVDWDQIDPDPAHAFTYATSASFNTLSSEIQKFNQLSGYYLPEVPAQTTTAEPAPESTSGSREAIAWVVLGIGFVIFLWRLVKGPRVDS
ncbi:MAG TPA: hypothetical protein VEC38_04330, partial [Candidatus Binataceae bacterium]|nr:hypothetical protein [Candidatus Binataceae bacterium]